MGGVALRGATPLSSANPAEVSMVTTTKDTEPAADEPQLETPALDVDDGEARAENAALKAQLEAQLKVKDAKEHDSKMKRMQAVLSKQPKVKVRIRKELGPQTVIINGARFNLPAGIPVDVPQQVAEMLSDAEII